GDDRLPSVSIVPDEPNNALVITATAKEYRRLRQILERIDIMPNQVLLEATIAEVKLNDQLKYGIRTFLQQGSSRLTFNDNSTGTVAPAFPGFSSFFNTPNVQVAINALSTVTDVNVVSSPTLMVLDNKRAT
ncbi:type II secretion system protein GspD, partial [Herbaspirillum sp. HC18]